MATFDGWEAQLYGPNTLAHFRTRGSKNGVRRYQTESGEWTPLGLRERKKREGWGEGRRAARAERKAARAEKRAANAAARKERMDTYKEKKRSSNPKTMTEAELRKKIERLKLEQEYKELKKSPVLTTGAKLITSILDYKNNKATREFERKKLQIEHDKVLAEVTKAKENTKRAQADARKAANEAEKMKADVKGGLTYERQATLKRAKIDWKATTLHGGIIRRINASLTSGVSEKQKAIRTAEGKIAADRILSNAKKEDARKSAAEAQKEQKRQEREARRASKRTDRIVRKYSDRLN